MKMFFDLTLEDLQKAFAEAVSEAVEEHKAAGRTVYELDKEGYVVEVKT